MKRIKIKIRPAIAGKIAIITGASSGIGESAALEFASAGAKVVLAARRIERLERLAETIRAAGGVALAVQTDVTVISQIRSLVQTTLTTFGRIDILANIAGAGYYDWFEELSSENLREHYEVNVIGLAELTREVLPTMKAQRSGYILNMCSYSSVISAPPLTVYASTKYAVEGLTDGLRRELIPWGIKVMRIHPSGVTGTEFKAKAARDGGIQFKSISLGQVSREKVAKTLVRLVEKPRRSVYLGRIYDGLGLVNKMFPGIIDWASAIWVRHKQRQELKKGKTGI
ncbi:MAG TPA: SDR family NAD(P)-dependent oxidoreductase [Anaerolineales bacterium]|nr:SDR family NAD(P)-dependent oxidoreductase [Anaerolineales bacterium]